MKSYGEVTSVDIPLKPGSRTQCRLLLTSCMTAARICGDILEVLNVIIGNVLELKYPTV